MKRILNYPGSKWNIANLIIDNMPTHKSYLEPFCGSCAVFMNKPKTVLETINDMDGRLVNLFTVMRDEPEKLQYLIAHTLYSREEYIRSQEIADDELEDARRMAVRLWFGVGGKTHSVPGFRKNISWNGPYNAYEWTDMYSRIGIAAARLKNAQIENMDAFKLIEQHNDKDTLIYCDPPYIPSSLVSAHYQHDFSIEQHQELLLLLKKHEGNVMLSGYESELYNRELAMWPRIEKLVKVGITSEKKTDRQEVIWCNFEPPAQLSLFDVNMKE
ncbi:DNA adenine methylase [Listeria monocytogenes]|uniref:DNA adenine methylase n=1 Tax=Listeria monocytogenes TaxID=1639 RepID=UPI000BDF5E92|nr:DNA adenine methylase [Listeria monocytogenes]EAC5079602.1 DNA adenine methylase [Listeria monocytogenes]EAC6159086.1 DNA adenine methylase [Listeria monocytogenes]EAC7675220.1 DNA adenine methylase [Listeria monocytogenes]EAC7684177.1 DNA adenine methylase [Listeria monocytogenes]EAC7838755.1 DNA adenine methylase [Listeria monocytogenes]